MSSVKLTTTGGNGGTVELKGPANTTSNAAVQLTLPVDDGSADQYLKTNGSGVLSWATVSASSDVVDDTTPQLGGDLETNGHNILLGDSSNGADDDVIRIGAGQDLNLYHDGTNSWIVNKTGNLNFYAKHGEYGMRMLPDANVELYFDNNKKLETTNTGISVTGSVTPSSGIYLGGSGGSNYLNDYEKGSWDATCDNSVTLTHDELFYTKIGRLVHVCGYLTVNSDNSNSAFIINNLPFAGNSGFGLSAPFCRLYNWNLDSDCKWVAGYTEANKVYFQQVRDDLNNPALAADSGAVMILSLTYYQN